MPRMHVRHPDVPAPPPPAGFRYEGYDKGLVFEHGQPNTVDSAFDRLARPDQRHRRFDTIYHLANMTLRRELDALPQAAPDFQTGEAEVGIHYLRRGRGSVDIATVAMSWPGDPLKDWEVRAYTHGQRTRDGVTVQTTRFAANGSVQGLEKTGYDRSGNVIDWAAYRLQQTTGTKMIKAVDLIKPVAAITAEGRQVFAHLGYSASMHAGRLPLEDRVELVAPKPPTSRTIPLSPSFSRATDEETGFFDLVLPPAEGLDIELSAARVRSSEPQEAPKIVLGTLGHSVLIQHAGLQLEAEAAIDLWNFKPQLRR